MVLPLPAESFIHQILSVLYAFAQSILGVFGDLFLGVVGAFGSSLDLVFSDWGQVLGGYGVLAPTLAVTGFGATMVAAYITLDVADAAKDALGGE
jgi:uncharacterized membrane protein YeaQ/YmgE (transglycosylase-associated protein family)